MDKRLTMLLLEAAIWGQPCSSAPYPVMIDDKDSQDSQDKIKIAIFILKPHLIWITI